MDYRAIRAFDCQLAGSTDAEIDAAYADIREDGTIEGPPVETHYRAAERIWLDDKGVIHIEMDDGPVNIETRLFTSTLEALGFKRTETS